MAAACRAWKRGTLTVALLNRLLTRQKALFDSRNVNSSSSYLVHNFINRELMGYTNHAINSLLHHGQDCAPRVPLLHRSKQQDTAGPIWHAK
jgi:hypothetical protein